MFGVFLVLVAAAVFLLWSLNGAKTSKRKVATAFLRAFEDRVVEEVRYPTWWHDNEAQQALRQILASIPAKAAPYEPDLIRQWLEARMTEEDISTSLYYAEKVGFSVPEQIALVVDFALMFLAQDLIKATGPVDKLIMLRLIAAAKMMHDQEFIDFSGFSYGVVEKFYREFGARDDGEDNDEFGPTILTCDFPFRTGEFHSILDWSDNPKSDPEAHIYLYRPHRSAVT